MSLYETIDLGLLVFTSIFLWGEPLSISLKSQAAILYNPENKSILFEKNSSELFYHPASITKIATAAYVLRDERLDLNLKIVAEQEALASISSEAKKKAQYSLPSYWLEPGEVMLGSK